MICAVDGREPRLHPSCFIARGASLIGEVELGEGASVWYGAVVRGDAAAVKIGARTNVQDLCVLHVERGSPLRIGDDVTVGHRAILHGCKIGDRVLVGMGAIVMNGAEVGADSIIGAGALVTEGTVIPPRSLVVGFPAQVKRALTDAEVESTLASARGYAAMAVCHAEAGLGSRQG